MLKNQKLKKYLKNKLTKKTNFEGTYLKKNMKNQQKQKHSF